MRLVNGRSIQPPEPRDLLCASPITISTTLSPVETWKLWDLICRDPLNRYYLLDGMRPDHLFEPDAKKKRMWYAHADEVVLGYCLVHQITWHQAIPLRGYLWIYVAPVYRALAEDIWTIFLQQIQAESFGYLYGVIHARHRRSQAFARSIGFQRVGLLPAYLIIGGQPHDAVLYTMKVT